MKHGISEQEWEAYLEEQLTGAARDRVESHMLGCLRCWEHYERMKLATGQLHAAGAEVRRLLTLSDEQLQAGLRGVFARIRAAQSGRTPQTEIGQRLEFLAVIMAPMCGSLTASRALRAAAHSSPARSLECVTPDNWEPFMESLTSIATVMCGDTGAHLVRVSGQVSVINSEL